MKILVTGGAGFIGSHLCEELDAKHELVVLDNLSSGDRENLPEEVELIEADIKELECIQPNFEDVDVVFHLAANPMVNTFPGDREKDFDENLKGTKNVLEACERQEVDHLVFTSSSVVYGEDVEIPTPEDANLDPISMYGATKAGGEHICKVYAQIFEIDLTIVRLANIIGGRSDKGVTYDFVHKLKDDPEELEILGNGRQSKSYIHVEDTVKGMIKAWKSGKTVFNIGNEDAIDVTRIAEIVSDEMNLDPDFNYTGGRRGWKGDVPEMRLDITRIKNEGWEPELDSEKSVRRTVRELLESE